MSRNEIDKRSYGFPCYYSRDTLNLLVIGKMMAEKKKKKKKEREEEENNKWKLIHTGFVR